MLPSVLSHELMEGVRAFLRATFPPSTPEFGEAFDAILNGVDRDKLFQGPYHPHFPALCVWAMVFLTVAIMGAATLCGKRGGLFSGLAASFESFPESVVEFGRNKNL